MEMRGRITVMGQHKSDGCWPGAFSITAVAILNMNMRMERNGRMWNGWNVCERQFHFKNGYINAWLECAIRSHIRSSDIFFSVDGGACALQKISKILGGDSPHFNLRGIEYNTHIHPIAAFLSHH